MKTRKLISFVLAIVMLVGALSVGTFAATEYRDVASDRWSADDIAYATEKGYMNGVGDGRFNPDGTMERAMIVTVLYRMAGAPKINFVEKFKDVPAGKYYSDAVIWASSKNITNGATATTFEPEGKLTREQMATFFARYADYFKYIKTDIGADITGYSDYDSISSYAVTALSWANRYGIIKGDTETTISPKKPATREQFAAILHRFDTAEFSIDDYRVVYNEPTLHSEYTEREYPLVTDADFYVAVDGNDSDDGTFEHPFATFARAKEAVRELKKTKASEIKVAFMAGNYGELDNLTFTSEDSGSEEAPITYCAYGDGDVTFSNGIEIKLDEFKPLDKSDKNLFQEKKCDDIYKVDLSEKKTLGEYTISSLLYESGKPLTPARFPNNGYFGGLNYTSYSEPTKIALPAFFKKRFENYHTSDGILCVGHLGNEYLGHAVCVEGYDSDTSEITLAQTPFQLNANRDSDCYFSNISEELDTAGEFWLDRANKVLYVYKPDSDYTLSTVNSFMNIDNADYINFVRLDFKHCTADAIRINADNVTIDQSEIIGVGADLDTYRYINQGNGGTYAVHMNGSNIKITNSEIGYLEGGGIIVYGGDCDNLIPSGNLIDNNYIHDFERTYETYKPGIRLMNSVGAVVSHNEIGNATHSAIIFGQAEEDRSGRAIDNIIEYNYIHDVIEYPDSGAVYGGRTYADRGNIIRYNYFAHIGADGWTIYLDDGLSGQTVHGNIFYEAGSYSIFHSGGRDNTITDNITIAEYGISPLRIWAKYAEQIADGGVEALSPWTWPTYYESYKLIPAEGTEGRKKWEERWPELFDMIADLSLSSDRLTDRNFIANSAGSIFKNNLSFFERDLKDHTISSEYALKFNTFEDNPIYLWNESPDDIFVNPIIGDYNIREDSPVKLDIPFSKIGRY